MSVIAWDGKTIAADMQGTYGNIRRKSHKLFRETIKRKSYIIGLVGPVIQSQAMLNWCRGGFKENDFPISQQTDDENWARIIVVELGTGNLFYYDNHPVCIPIKDPFGAWGSGGDIAIGALAAGTNARRAVEIACEFDVHCGMGIEEYSVF